VVFHASQGGKRDVGRDIKTRPSRLFAHQPSPPNNSQVQLPHFFAFPGGKRGGANPATGGPSDSIGGGPAPPPRLEWLPAKMPGPSNGPASQGPAPPHGFLVDPPQRPPPARRQEPRVPFQTRRRQIRLSGIIRRLPSPVGFLTGNTLPSWVLDNSRGGPSRFHNPNDSKALRPAVAPLRQRLIGGCRFCPFAGLGPPPSVSHFPARPSIRLSHWRGTGIDRLRPELSANPLAVLHPVLAHLGIRKNGGRAY